MNEKSSYNIKEFAKELEKRTTKFAIKIILLS